MNLIIIIDSDKATAKLCFSSPDPILKDYFLLISFFIDSLTEPCLCRISERKEIKKEII